MNNPLLTGFIGLVIAALIGGFVFMQNSERILAPAPSGEEITGTPADGNEPGTNASQGEGGNETPEPGTSETNSPGNAGSGTSDTGATGSGITLTEVASHNSRTSCWSIINGSVYDLTSWIPKHPGGEQRILDICGIDGSTKFNKKHGSSTKVAGILAGFKIGVLGS